MIRKGKKVILTENVLRLIMEGKVRVIKDKKLKYGKYKIIKRYAAKV